MKSIISVLVLNMIAALQLNAQQFLDIEYLVRFNDQFDRGRSDRLHNGFLMLRGQKSRYYTIPRESFSPATENDIVIMPDTGNQVFIDQALGILLAEELDLKGRSFYVSDSLYPMRWKIHQEEKWIDSLRCFKATCLFRGRDYIAWYAPDIPLPAGPWKMGGLPGLIVDLQDVDGNLLIRLVRMSGRNGASNGEVLLMPEPRYSVTEHFAERRKFMQRLSDNARTTATGDCAGCQQQSRIEFYMWEKIW